MRSIIVTVFLSCALLSSPAIALPRPQRGDTAGVSDGTLAGPAAANPFPADDQAVNPDAAAAATSGTPQNAGAATTGNGPAAASTGDSAASPVANSPQDIGLVDGSVAVTPLSLDSASSTPPPQAKLQASGGNNTDAPREMTGTLLGMPNCSDIFYNPRWDSCDQATGKLKTKAEPNVKRREFVPTPQQLSAISKRHKTKRQVAENDSDNAEHENDPTIQSGVAGVDDGAMPRTTNTPRASQHNSPGTVNNWNVPFEDSNGSGVRAREIKQNNPRAANNWNVPFDEPDNSGISASASSGSQNSGGSASQTAQNKSPGNISPWNVPFELARTNQGGKKQRRQSPITNDLRLQSGPLSGEDRDLDGALPYMEVGAPKVKRQGDNQEDKSPHVEVGPPGLGGARNTIINKRAQPDFNYVHPTPTGTDGESIPRGAVINKRQYSNDSNNAPTSSSSGSGYLAKLAAEEAAGASADLINIPSHPGKRGEEVQSEFDSVAPHHDGNHEVIPEEVPPVASPAASAR